MTVAPRAAASWTAAEPTAPDAPCTSSVSPAETASSSSTRAAVAVAMGSAAASAQPRPSGFGATAPTSARTYSAYAPVALRPRTSSPAANSVTPSPVSSTTPANSLPGVAGSGVGNAASIQPLRILWSTGLTPAALTSTRICPGPAWTSSTRARCRTSGPPNSSYTIASITVSSAACRVPACAARTAPPILAAVGRARPVSRGPLSVPGARLGP